MVGIIVTIPIACFRKGMSRQYLETESIPHPSTCYGFLLSLVGETEREQHQGVRVTPVLLSRPVRSLVLRTVWRVKDKKNQTGVNANKSLDYQQLLTGIRLIIWLDSTEEQIQNGPTLEERVKIALDPSRRSEIDRFGGLSLGESTHLVDEVSLYDPKTSSLDDDEVANAQILSCGPDGLQAWTVWVDHVGAEYTKYTTGSLVSWDKKPPELTSMAQIHS